MERNSLIIMIGKISKAISSIHRVKVAKTFTSIHRIKVAVVSIAIIMSSFIFCYSLTLWPPGESLASPPYTSFSSLSSSSTLPASTLSTST